MATAAAEAGGTLMAATAGASAGLANVVLSTAIAGMVGSMTSQVIGTGSINWAQVGESGLVSGLTAGLTNGITFNGTNGIGFTTGATTGPPGRGANCVEPANGGPRTRCRCDDFCRRANCD
jgi:filamentous hemagglutinin